MLLHGGGRQFETVTRYQLLGVSVAVTLQTLTLSSLVRSQYPLPVFKKELVMKSKPIVRERNCFVRLALFRKAGVHRKSNKALRKAQKQIPMGV